MVRKDAERQSLLNLNYLIMLERKDTDMLERKDTNMLEKRDAVTTQERKDMVSKATTQGRKDTTTGNAKSQISTNVLLVKKVHTTVERRVITEKEGPIMLAKREVTLSLSLTQVTVASSATNRTKISLPLLYYSTLLMELTLPSNLREKHLAEKESILVQLESKLTVCNMMLKTVIFSRSTLTELILTSRSSLLEHPSLTRILSVSFIHHAQSQSLLVIRSDLSLWKEMKSVSLQSQIAALNVPFVTLEDLSY
mmetsp:Transcript_11162/g.17249  ORF Transcript_11162/g.17249 Transcript_11162/m.17249 type:complete len:253 (+) Transcript_11162:124-882(+)